MRGQFAVYLCVVSGFDEMLPGEQRPECREEEKAEKTDLGLRLM